MRSKWAKYWYLTPALAMVILTIAYPLISALVTSFQEWQLGQSPAPEGFVGLENYRRVIADSGFWNSVWVTTLFTLLSVVLTVAIALGMALLLQGPGKFKTFAKATLIFPFAVAPALKGFSWRFMLNDDYGIYNTIVTTVIPFTDHILWLGDPFWAVFSIAMSEVWGWSSLIALMFIGALGAIDSEIQEAAEVDGATILQTFFRVTLPLIIPVILVATLLKTIWSLKMIDQVVTMTGGGPGDSTEMLNYFVYQQGFSFLDMGYASALAWVSVLLISIFVIFYVIVMNRQDAI